MQGDRMQDELLSREQAKIEARRQRNEVLRLRFLQNAKKRLIGIDTEGLDAQIAEKQRMQGDHDEVLRMERLQAVEIERLMADAEAEEKAMKAFQMQQIRAEWEKAAELKKNMHDNTPDFDDERAGPASAQIMAGADPFRADRLKAQQEQMRNWIQQQIAEKEYQKAHDKDDDVNYVEMLKAIDDIRGQAEQEEADMKRYIQASVREQNRELAEAQRARRNAPKDDSGSSLPAFDEDKGRAMDKNGRIIQKDMFKGFTKEQQQKMLLENARLVDDKRARDEAERELERYWAAQAVLASRAMEHAEYEEKMMKEDMNNTRLSILQQQIDEQRKIKEERDRGRMGEIDLNYGFFDGFGKSHR